MPPPNSQCVGACQLLLNLQPEKLSHGQAGAFTVGATVGAVKKRKLEQADGAVKGPSVCMCITCTAPPWVKDDCACTCTSTCCWVCRYLADRDLPIWVSLARGHLELYREIQTVRPPVAVCAGMRQATPAMHALWGSLLHTPVHCFPPGSVHPTCSSTQQRVQQHTVRKADPIFEVSLCQEARQHPVTCSRRITRSMLLCSVPCALLLQVSLGDCPQLEQHFGCKGPFWSRQYFFWHDGSPLTLIHEVFSNNLEACLGPSSSSSSSDNSSGGGLRSGRQRGN